MVQTTIGKVLSSPFYGSNMPDKKYTKTQQGFHLIFLFPQYEHLDNCSKSVRKLDLVGNLIQNILENSLVAGATLSYPPEFCFQRQETKTKKRRLCEMRLFPQVALSSILVKLSIYILLISQFVKFFLVNYTILNKSDIDIRHLSRN